MPFRVNFDCHLIGRGDAHTKLRPENHFVCALRSGRCEERASAHTKSRPENHFVCALRSGGCEERACAHTKSGHRRTYSTRLKVVHRRSGYLVPNRRSGYLSPQNRCGEHEFSNTGEPNGLHSESSGVPVRVFGQIEPDPVNQTVCRILGCDIACKAGR